MNLENINDALKKGHRHPRNIVYLCKKINPTLTKLKLS